MNQKDTKSRLPLVALVYLMMLLGGTFSVHSQDDVRHSDIKLDERMNLCESDAGAPDGSGLPVFESEAPASAIGQIPVRIRLNRCDLPRWKRNMSYA